METVITIVITVVASSGFWNLLQLWIQSRGSKKTAEQTLLTGLARAEIIRLGNEYIEQKEITQLEYAEYCDFCEAYKKLPGGNGGGAHKYEEVKNKVNIV